MTRTQTESAAMQQAARKFAEHVKLASDRYAGHGDEQPHLAVHAGLLIIAELIGAAADAGADMIEADVAASRDFGRRS